MDSKHRRSSVQSRIPSPPRSLASRVLWACPSLIATGVFLNFAVPLAAHSQINGRVISAPSVSVKSPASDDAVTPKAPVQVDLPAPPPMKYVPGMQEALVATGPVGEQESKDLDAAVAAFHDAPAKAGTGGDYDDYAKPLLAFIDAHPQSNWNAALYTNIGLGYYHAGYYSRVFTYLEKAWQLGRGATSPQAHLMIDRAVAELARMHARVGHDKELEALFADIGNRPIGGAATELMRGAHAGLWVFQHNPDVGYLCGPKALENVLITLKAGPKQIKIADDARSSPHGFSLEQLAALADKAKLKYKLIHREPGQPIPVPSIINWNVHHYAAVIAQRGGKYVIKDPTFASGSEQMLTAKAIEAESSGYFLVPAKAFKASPKAGWHVLSAQSDEAKAVYGMGYTTGNVAHAVRTSDKNTNMCHAKGNPPQGGANAPQVGPDQNSSSCTPQRMTEAYAHTMMVSLNLLDTPVGYTPQKGPNAQTSLFYNQLEDQTPGNFTSNVSPLWTHSWLAYVQDDPNNLGASVSSYASGGGGYDYSGYGYFQNLFYVDTYDNSQLQRVPQSGTLSYYLRVLPDGSTETYALSNGATSFPRTIFLTTVTDPQGNSTTLNYDSQFRLTSVTDAMGRSTTFTYGLTGFPMLITKITDAFGRFSQLTYDTSQRLSSITDPIGITSSFTYGSGTEPNFVTQLTTPYGNSKFSDAVPTGDTVEGNTRALTLTDPLGYTEFLYFYEKANLIPDSDPANTIPTGMSTNNSLLEWRNTYYYDKHAFAYPGAVTLNTDGSVNTENPLLSHITHWVHNQEGYPNITGRAAESIKAPLENRIWYNYPGQPGPIQNGYLDRPAAAGRVLVDGTPPSSEQVSPATYNSNNGSGHGGYGGLPASITDASGRTTTFTYTNFIDLNVVQQLTAPSTYTTIATFSNYNTQHEPQTYVGADGQTWNYTYNAAGQLATVTDPNSGVTTYNYDTTGRLSTVQNANLVTVLTLTYDADDRVHTRKDSEGYVLTYNYDKLDRVTKITYPDGTTDLYNYNFQSGPLMGTPSLELRKHTDRLGRVTTYGYDAARRLTSVTEPITATTTRTTNYDYYEDGTLKDIIDAKGNDTHWDIDLESRPTDKIYAFGSGAAQTETYAYEPTSSRLLSVTDALGQVKTFTYASDDRITGITYTSTVNPTPNVTLNWDPYFPRLSSMVDGLGTTNYTYTAIGTLGALKLASVDETAFTNDTIGLTYDALSRLAGRTISGGNETFGYDPISRLNSHGTPLGSFTYGYLGQTDQTTSRSVTNGATTVSTNWVYDTNTNDRRLININNSGVTRSYTLSYLSGSTQNPYDIQSITDTAASGHPWATQSHSYGYDMVDRLLSATSTFPGTLDYIYDKVDNATSIANTGGTISGVYNALNEITTFDGLTYSYDLDGNLLSGDGVHTYKWDAENRLIEIDYVGTSNKSVFSYDGLGHRTVDAETVSGTTTTTRYLWCGSTICQTRDGSDNVLRRDVDEGEYNVTTGKKPVYMPDQLGSARDALGASTGNLLESYDFTPYGSVARSAGTVPIDYQFAGLFAHAASALNLGTYRAQDGVTGRFINRDPIGELAGPNVYAYVDANPIRGIDPWGLAELCTRPILSMPLAPASHCFIKLDDNKTLSFDPTGVHSDLAPWAGSCQPMSGEQNDSCLKREMNECKASQYSLTGFNCCHCAENAMKACGQSIPVGKWPNWPINPGPQPGEPGGLTPTPPNEQISVPKPNITD